MDKGGHDHTLQYHRRQMRENTAGENFFISGAGAGLYKKAQDPPQFDANSGFLTEFYWSGIDAAKSVGHQVGSGFLTFCLGFEHYNASFIDSSGNILFEKTIEF